MGMSSKIITVIMFFAFFLVCADAGKSWKIGMKRNITKDGMTPWIALKEK
jgi:hypothetical protein